MFPITLDDVMAATGGRLLLPGLNGTAGITGVSTDSRTLKPGELFVALSGERFDGHTFIGEAVGRQAGALLVQHDHEAHLHLASLSLPVLSVPSTLAALGDLGAWFRRKFPLPVVAVTGSVGKTTTKEMSACVLETKYRVHRSAGNYNNLVGIPLSLFALKPDHQVSVLELGMSTPGEIGRLTEITRPEAGVITNIAPAHLETMGSLENIARAKFELLDGLGETKTVILNADDPFLAARARQERRPVVTFGIQNPADIWAGDRAPDENGCYRFRVNDQTDVRLAVLGLGNVYNALAALAVATRFGITFEKAAKALENYRPAKMRLEVFTVAGVKIIDDSYNANPYSLRCALETLGQMNPPKRDSGRRVAVLADMLELGEKQETLHREVGSVAAKAGVDFLIAVGPLAGEYLAGATPVGMFSSQMRHFENNPAALDFLLGWLRAGDLVLVKGSRGMKADAIVTGLKELLPKQS